MNPNLNAKSLSHIIIFADKNLPEEVIRAFCTNTGSENPRIRFTYLCYDNRSEDDEVSFLAGHKALFDDDPASVFFISDSENAISFMKDAGIATAALLTQHNSGKSFAGVLYCIEDIEYISYDVIERMWMRHHGIPWIITRTDRLVIREQTPGDIKDLYHIYSDKDTARYTEDLYEDPAMEAEYLRKYIDNQYRYYEYGIWALTLKEDATFIGRAGISRREGYELPELGYVIGKDHRRQGYAKEALTAIMEYGYSKLGFDEYMAFTRRANVPSVRLLQSLGFTVSGHEFISGHKHDMYTFRILSE